MKRKEINKIIRERIHNYFEGLTKEEITYEEISNFMSTLNVDFIKWSHDLIKEAGITHHVDRISFKNSLRLYTMLQLCKSYDEAVIEYLWNIIKRNEKQNEV